MILTTHVAPLQGARPVLLALGRLVALGASAVALLLLLFALTAPPVHGDSLDQQAREIGLELRCPVCQNVSVADSSSELAGQMRQVIREQLQEGKNKQEITAYFLERYGESVLFDPPKQGFSLLAWVVTPLGVSAGAAVLWRMLRRRRRTRPVLPTDGSVLDLNAYRSRLQADLAALEEPPVSVQHISTATRARSGGAGGRP